MPIGFDVQFKYEVVICASIFQSPSLAVRFDRWFDRRVNCYSSGSSLCQNCRFTSSGIHVHDTYYIFESLFSLSIMITVVKEI